MKYHRVYVPGGTYFFTIVTYQRRPILSTPETIQLLQDAIRYTMTRMPFSIIASVILPDHMHFIWTMPEESFDFSTRWRLIKSYFTRYRYKPSNISESASRVKKGEQDVWQRRFWEHLIRDETDLSHHIEYIHYNPVKHGFVDYAKDWQLSSFLDYVKNGLYQLDWGESDKVWLGERWME